MNNDRIQRRLVAILAADVVGYSRLIERDEQGTLTELKRRWNDVVDPLVVRHGGRICNTIGDAVLAEFGSTVGAVECGVELQKAMAAANDAGPSERRMVLRVGIHLG
ncbi:adenylate/guanylate cyclase domain-containing protein, partial [Rhizobiaceae sp. 2RAB30]